MVKIMLACSAGMSTSLLVTRMQKAAEERGLDAKNMLLILVMFYYLVLKFVSV